MSALQASEDRPSWDCSSLDVLAPKASCFGCGVDKASGLVGRITCRSRSGSGRAFNLCVAFEM